jgi:hypothetical protein
MISKNLQDLFPYLSIQILNINIKKIKNQPHLLLNLFESVVVVIF